jgi:hypothetical protein
MALGISDAVELSGRVVELVKKGMTLELQERITELREAVLNAKEEVLTLREENSELKRAAAEKQRFKFDGELYWREEEDGSREGPFCQGCYDSKALKVRLQPLPSGWRHKWRCNVCNYSFVSVSRDPS